MKLHLLWTTRTELHVTEWGEIVTQKLRSKFVFCRPMVRAPAIPTVIFRGFLRSLRAYTRLRLLPSTKFLSINFSPVILPFLRQRHRFEINHKKEKIVKDALRVGEGKLFGESYCHDFSDYRRGSDL
jgi:hypothetical protein